MVMPSDAPEQPAIKAAALAHNHHEEVVRLDLIRNSQKPLKAAASGMYFIAIFAMKNPINRSAAPFELQKVTHCDAHATSITASIHKMRAWRRVVVSQYAIHAHTNEAGKKVTRAAMRRKVFVNTIQTALSASTKDTRKARCIPSTIACPPKDRANRPEAQRAPNQDQPMREQGKKACAQNA